MQKVDYRVKTVNVNPQKVLTRDNVTVTVGAIVFYKVRNEKDEVKKAVLEVENFSRVTVSYGQTMLRAIIGRRDLDDILQNRAEIADELREDLDEATNEFGIHIRNVEIQDVSIPNSMEREMAAQAEAERNRRAKIKEAKGELQDADGGNGSPVQSLVDQVVKNVDAEELLAGLDTAGTGDAVEPEQSTD